MQNLIKVRKCKFIKTTTYAKNEKQLEFRFKLVKNKEILIIGLDIIF